MSESFIIIQSNHTITANHAGASIPQNLTKSKDEASNIHHWSIAFTQNKVDFNSAQK